MSGDNSVLRDAAQLTWIDDVPFAENFDDPYYSRDSGLEETRHVFIKGNSLASAWVGKQRFSILETGLGTGLNFLATAALWRSLPDSARPENLRFVSVENFPLSVEDTQRALDPWRNELPHAQAYLDQLPPRASGHYTLEFDHGKISLSILIGDVLQALGQYDEGQHRFDAVYLDGFAPAKNPQMWRFPVLQRIAALSRSGATISTFSAAGELRRGLERAGYQMQRQQGFGRKRDMLAGVRDDSAPVVARNREPWFRRPSPARAERVAVIGAGLAGVSVARALCDRGIATTLFERQSAPGAQTSSVPMAGWHPNFSHDFNVRSQLLLHGYLATQRFANSDPAAAKSWRQNTGVVFVADNEERVSRMRPLAERLARAGFDTRFVDAAETSALAGLDIKFPALATDMGGSIDMAALIKTLRDHQLIELRTNADVTRVGWSADGTQVHTSEGAERFDAVVLATGGADLLSTALGVETVQRVRGQVTVLDGNAFAGQHRLVCFKGYLTTANADGQHVIGASVEHDGDAADTTPLLASDDENIRRLQAVLPGDYNAVNSWVGWRRIAQDRLPIVGALPDYAWYRETLGPWTKGGAPGPCPQPRYRPGVWLSLAHASRGTGTALMAAELLAAQITGDALPLPASLVHALHPARFIIRELKAG